MELEIGRAYKTINDIILYDGNVFNIPQDYRNAKIISVRKGTIITILGRKNDVFRAIKNPLSKYNAYYVLTENNELRTLLHIYRPATVGVNFKLVI